MSQRSTILSGKEEITFTYTLEQIDEDTFNAYVYGNDGEPIVQIDFFDWPSELIEAGVPERIAYKLHDAMEDHRDKFMYMDHGDFVERFEELYDEEPFNDLIAAREAWNNYTDSLCKNGEISEWQYNNWPNPY